MKIPQPLYEVSLTLSDVAMGRKPADTVIKNGTLVNVCTAELIEHVDVAISCGRIALVGDASHCVGELTRVIDAGGAFIAPGFLDGHMHVESSQLTVGEYARSVIPHGTSGVFMDPHEIANVLGLEGVQFIREDADRTPLKCFITTPSCVPAVPGFEDGGAELTPEDVAGTMAWPDVAGLGEMMNFPGILYSQPKVHAMVQETLRAGKTPTGHYSMPETASGLNAYVASGVRCCHESTREEDALAKMRLGMYAMLREGSAWRDLAEVAKAVTRHEVDSRYAVLISDDTHPHTLIAEGHLDHILRRAVQEGIDPVRAIQMVTINCATCFHMDHEIGSVTPGKIADIALLDNLTDFTVTQMLIGGELVAKDGAFLAEMVPYQYPDKALHSMHMPEALTESSFRIAAPEGAGERVHCRVIEIIPARVGTIERFVDLPVSGGEILPESDALKCAVIERHKGTGTVGLGFVQGFGVENGAMASTVSHDAHNLLVVGSNDRDMAVCANALRECGGGMVAARDGKILGLVPLPIAGLMTDASAADAASLIAGLEQAWKTLGCTMVSPFMTMALIALACLPELRLTNRGLVDCRTFEFVPLVAE